MKMRNNEDSYAVESNILILYENGVKLLKYKRRSV